MKKKLIVSALTKFLLGFVMVGAMLFISAGTLNFPCGWLFMGLLFVPMFIAGIVMLKKNPSLLEHRLNARETQSEQKSVILLSGIMFIAGFVLAGIDYRFGWSRLPKLVTAAASIVFVLSYIMYAEVLRENAYLSRTIEVQKEQKVIDTGLYGKVRHPMYSATVLLFLSIPLILGSLPAFAVFMVYPILIISRIKGEERFLEENLSGYTEYKQKVRYRLIPFVW